MTQYSSANSTPTIGSVSIDPLSKPSRGDIETEFKSAHLTTRPPLQPLFNRANAGAASTLLVYALQKTIYAFRKIDDLSP